MFARQFKTIIAMALAMLAMLAAVPAQAAIVVVDFEFSDGVDTASGTFSYDNANSGLLTYDDLISFEFTVAGQTFDLNYILTASNQNKSYFGYETTSFSFIPKSANNGPFLLSGLNKTYDDGFFIRDNSSGSLGEVSRGAKGIYFSAATQTVAAIPTPGTWMMTLLGFAFLGFVMRRRPRQEERFRAHTAVELAGAYA